jgi:hypothetical protein
MAEAPLPLTDPLLPVRHDLVADGLAPLLESVAAVNG